MSIPALGVDAAVDPMSVSADGTLELPADPSRVGWWNGGAAPGSAGGTVVIAGHIDSARLGLGALAGLGSLTPGAAVIVRGEGGSATYRVIGRRQYVKSALPESTFDQGSQPRLVLITCSGAFNRTTRHYADNTVVYAVPVT